VDGRGYPNGLFGEAIPQYAKILTIVDSYDAMTCERTYKLPLTKEEASRELLKNIDRQFDKELTCVFVEKVVGIPIESLMRGDEA